MSKTNVAILIAGLCLTAAAGAADIYKCPTAAGKVEFRDRPCDGGSGQKIDVRPSTAGAGSIEDIRAQDAALAARMKARRDADDAANAAAYAANERAYHQERSHRASEDLAQAIREGNNQRAADYANSYLVPQPYYRPYRSPSPSPAPRSFSTKLPAK